MGRARTQARHRAPARPWRPATAYLFAAALIIVCFGLTLGAITDALGGDDLFWAIFFTVAALIEIGIYFWIVDCWITLAGLRD